ncbi:MAG: outer membrane lipoprotein-sorting protein [Elusimicrobia bacterium]|nr:outer membrane lipoprotein-sorting protein [Elusimicrobiota bacterium]MBD3411532.1 outer membrane lipoprotein-sorting protein [Elusimicrobiota bacterium]
MHTLCKIIVPGVIVALVNTLYAVEQPDVTKIINYVDTLYRSSSSQSTVAMTISTPHWERTLVMDIWTEGMKKTFIRIKSPKKEQGVSTLRIGNEMWNYLPKANKVIKIPPSMMMSSWMGSDFTNDDLVKESTMIDDYTYRLVRPPEARNEWWYAELIPKPDRPIVWSKIILAVRKEDYIPVEEIYYDDNDKPVRRLEFTDITTFDNRKIPSCLVMIPLTKEGHKTVIQYRDIQFNVALDQDVFTLRHLRSGP